MRDLSRVYIHCFDFCKTLLSGLLQIVGLESVQMCWLWVTMESLWFKDALGSRHSRFLNISKSVSTITFFFILASLLYCQPLDYFQLASIPSIPRLFLHYSSLSLVLALFSTLPSLMFLFTLCPSFPPRWTSLILWYSPTPLPFSSRITLSLCHAPHLMNRTRG